MEKLYLPKILSFKVSAFFYSLLATGHELVLPLDNSLNILIGKNSIGKTTTIELILYSITGNFDHKVEFANSNNSFSINISNDKFKSRAGTKAFSSQDKITTTIKFTIKSHTIELEREILTDKIKKLLIDGKDIISDNLNAIYVEKMVELTCLEYEDFAFILKEFLIFEEEGEYLIWNENKQNKIFLMFFDCQENRFESINLETKKIATSKKQEAHHRTDLYKTQKAILSEIGSKSSNTGEASNFVLLSDLDTKAKKLELQLKELLEEKGKLAKSIVDTRAELNKNYIAQDEISGKLKELEMAFYGDKYNRYLQYYHKADAYKLCSFCNERLNNDGIKKLIEFKNTGCCPVCSSKIGILKSDKNIVADDLQELRNSFANSSTIIMEMEDELKLLQSDQDTIFSKIKNIIKELDECNNSLIELKIIKIKNDITIAGDLDTNSTSLFIAEQQSKLKNIDEQINEKDAAIKMYEGQIDKKRKELEVYYKEIQESYGAELDSFVEMLNENLILYFGDANVSFKKTAAVMTLQDDLSSNKDIKLYRILPTINNEQKDRMEDLSTSERLILEYIFRLTLIEYLEIKNQISTSFLLETSEGSFDFIKVDKLAKTIYDLSVKLTSSVTVVTNFNEPYFMRDYATKDNVFSFIDMLDDKDTDKIIIKPKIDELLGKTNVQL